MKKCHDCGHEHPNMASAARRLPSEKEWQERFFCHENSHSCYRDRYGSYWTEVPPIKEEAIGTFMKRMDEVLTETKEKITETERKLGLL